MRFLLKVNIPVESGNAAAKTGKLGATINSILADLKPEAVYFTDNNGQRSGFIFLDMQDASQIPAIAEPWFLAFNASVEIHPVMIPDDCQSRRRHREVGQEIRLIVRSPSRTRCELVSGEDAGTCLVSTHCHKVIPDIVTSRVQIRLVRQVRHRRFCGCKPDRQKMQ